MKNFPAAPGWRKIGPVLIEIISAMHCYRVGLVGKDFGDLCWCATRKALNNDEKAVHRFFANESEAKSYCENDMQLTNAIF